MKPLGTFFTVTYINGTDVEGKGTGLREQGRDGDLAEQGNTRGSEDNRKQEGRRSLVELKGWMSEAQPLTNLYLPRNENAACLLL